MLICKKNKIFFSSKFILYIWQYFPQLLHYVHILYSISFRALFDLAFIRDWALFRHVALAAASVEFFSMQFTAQIKFESDIIVLSLEHIMKTSVATRPGLVLNSVVFVATRG